jgi:hypothetical protein
MHSPPSDDDDDVHVDEGEPLASTRSTSHDATRQNFNASRRPPASPTPDQAATVSSRMSSRTLSAGPSSHLSWLSLKSNDDSDDDDHEDEDNRDHDHAGSEGELAGLRHATLSRGGPKVTCQVCTKVTIRPRKRTLSDVMRAEKQLDAEEAAATAARLRRELKREKIEAAKRRLL